MERMLSTHRSVYQEYCDVVSGVLAKIDSKVSVSVEDESCFMRVNKIGVDSLSAVINALKGLKRKYLGNPLTFSANVRPTNSHITITPFYWIKTAKSDGTIAREVTVYLKAGKRLKCAFMLVCNVLLQD